MGWCDGHAHALQKPKGMTDDSFSWVAYLRQVSASAVPTILLTDPSNSGPAAVLLPPTLAQFSHPGCAALRLSQKPTQRQTNVCESCKGLFASCFGSYGFRGTLNSWSPGPCPGDLTMCPESPNKRWCTHKCEMRPEVQSESLASNSTNQVAKLATFLLSVHFADTMSTAFTPLQDLARRLRALLSTPDGVASTPTTLSPLSTITLSTSVLVPTLIRGSSVAAERASSMATILTDIALCFQSQQHQQATVFELQTSGLIEVLHDFLTHGIASKQHTVAFCHAFASTKSDLDGDLNHRSAYSSLARMLVLVLEELEKFPVRLTQVFCL